MKRIIVIMICTAFLISVCACGAAAPETTTDKAPETTAAGTSAAETTVEAVTTAEETTTEAVTETETETETKTETEAEIRYMDDPLHFRRVAPEYFPKELSFLIPENRDDYIFMRMSDNYCCIGKEIVTVDEAKWFSAQCEAQGMTKQRESLGKSDDGSFDEYSALFDDERFEIHIFTSNVTMDQLEVDITIK